MKRNYEKPAIYFEEYALDMPVASGCDTEHIADVEDLVEQGWFNAKYSCNADQYVIDDQMENLFWDDNKLCYYSAINQAFVS